MSVEPRERGRALETLQRIEGLARGLAGWRRSLLALSAGVLSVLAMAPFHAWPMLGLTFPVLIWLIDADPRPRPAAIAGWWFGFGYFLAGLFWIGEAFLVEAEVFAWLLPFAVTAMPAGLAIFFAAAAAAATFAWHSGVGRVLSIALALSVAEWLRGHVLTGLPWNVIGYALTYPDALMQSAALIGIYGLTLVAVVALAAPLVLLLDVRAGRIPPHGARGPLIAIIALLIGLTSWGLSRLSAEAPADITGVRLRIVQPSVPQREKWRPENQERIFLDHIELSKRNAKGEVDDLAGITAVIWAEAAMPFLPLDSPAALALIGRMLPAGVHLITGALRVEPGGPGAGPSKRRVFNSLMVFGAGGVLAALYDKIHLVPFGEYLPLQALLEAVGLEQLTRIRGGFTPGPRPRPLLAVPGLPAIGPLVCYEAIFPGAVIQGAERPRLLVNVTNDGWFGNTTGPRQHLHQARVRAVEEGLPLIRAANNGISAAIDPRGRVIARIDLNVRGVMDTRVPGALAPPLYARVGDTLFWVLALATLLWLLVGSRRRDRG